MSDQSNSRRTNTDRRSLLQASGAALAGLGALTTLPGAAAQEDPEWPIGGPDDPEDPPEYEEPVPDEYDEYATITDDSGSIQFAVPAAWADVDGSPGGLGPALWAAPDLEGFATTWDVPGVEAYVTTQLGTDVEPVLEQFLEELEFAGDCAAGERMLVTSDRYAFLTQPLLQCAGTDTSYLAMAGAPIADPGEDLPEPDPGPGPDDDEMPGPGPGPGPDGDDDMPGPGPGPDGDDMPGPGPGPDGDDMPGPGPGPGPGPDGNGPGAPEDVLTDAPYVVILGIQVVGEQDLTAFETIVDTLETRSPDAQDV